MKRKVDAKKSEEAFQGLADLTEDQLAGISFSVPWQSGPTGSYASGQTDADGFSTNAAAETLRMSRQALQKECWNKYSTNPHINTNIRAEMGRLCGWGFETTSEIEEIQDAIEETEEDPRNRLYTFWPKFVGRIKIDGELFLCLTCHDDGFIEVDYIDPSSVSGNGDDDTGIIYHPNKALMPLFYNIKLKVDNVERTEQIPSIFIGRYPDLINIASKNPNFKPSWQKNSKSRKSIFKGLGGYKRFIISWDYGLLTRRAVSHLRTVLEWCNYYENLKKWEIDWKKSAGSYLWNFQIEDAKAFKMWLSLTNEQKRATGIFAPKSPGCTIVSPPGIKLQVVNPTLTRISEQDTDILHMITSGTNEPEDISTGQSKGTFASVQASRAPMSDRTSDEIAWFHRFLVFDFWGSVFFLKAAVNKFPLFFKRWEAYKFNEKTQEGEFRWKNRKPEKLVDVNFPSSEVTNLEGLSKGLLGVKHGPITETLGIEPSVVARRLGFSGYGRHRLRKATEDEKYPELLYTADAESLQETLETGEGKKPKEKEPTKD